MCIVSGKLFYKFDFPVENMQQWYNILIIYYVFFSNMVLTLVDGNRSRGPLRGLSTIKITFYIRMKVLIL